MFVKITSSGGRQYVKLVEAFRDNGGVARQRVIATLGRIEAVRAGESNALINGLLRAADQPTMDEGTGSVSFAPALTVGDTWMLTALWQELGFAEAFRRILRPRRRFDASCCASWSSIDCATRNRSWVSVGGWRVRWCRTCRLKV